MITDSKTPAIVKVPKGFLFPIKPKGPLQLDVTTLDGEQYTLLIGGVGPLSGETNASHPSLCLRHLRLILKILYGRRFDSPEIPISYKELLDTDGQEQRRLLLRTITELASAWLHRVRRDKVDAFRFIELDTQIYYKKGVDGTDISVVSREENIYRRYLRHVKFNECFWRAFLNWSNCWNVRADVVCRIQSDIAAASYLLLTPRAHHPEISESNKGAKDAAELLREIGATVPMRSGRVNLGELRRIFERRRGGTFSVLEQMKGLPTWKGYLYVGEKLEENASGTGYNIRFWAVNEHPYIATYPEVAKARGALMEFWEGLGLSQAEFDRCRHPEWAKLEPYEIERIGALGYPVDKNEKFLELARSFIGPIEFGVVIGSAHMALQGDRRPRNMERYFGGALRNTFREVAQRYANKRAST